MTDKVGPGLRATVRRLNTALGSTLVSALAGSQDSQAAEHWAETDVSEPGPEATERIVFAYEQWQRIVEVDGEQIARAWFVGMNPWLGEDSPVNAVREGRFREVRTAVTALLTDASSS